MIQVQRPFTVMVFISRCLYAAVSLRRTVAGLSVPSAGNDDGVNVTEDDIRRFGLSPPSGARLRPAVRVSAADVAELGLSVPAANDSGVDRVTPADIVRYGDLRRPAVSRIAIAGAKSGPALAPRASGPSCCRAASPG